MRKNEEMFAEVIGALPETKRKKEVEAEWSTAGGKSKSSLRYWDSWFW